MRKVFQFMMISADGYFEAPGHDLSWHNTDEEFQAFANQQLDTADTLVFGHITYRLMERFWPSDEATESDPDTAARMNSMKKLLFSHTPAETNWNNVEVSTKDPVAVLGELKNQEGKDIAILASSNLCLSLLNSGVIDEIRLMVNPVLLGNGTSLFSGLPASQKLKLLSSQSFASGNVLLTYSLA